MASFAPLHTGQFIVKSRTLSRHRALWVTVAALIVLVPYVTFELGRMSGGYSVVSSLQQRMGQSARIASLETEVTNLQRQLRTAQLARKVDQQSSDVTQQSFATLQATIQKQTEELTFYKAIVTPDANAAKEPLVQRLEVHADSVEHRYVLRLVLIQSMQATTNAQGTVQVRLTGTKDGQSATIALSDLMVGEHAASLPFAYRYFQTLEQLIELPAEFQPQAVQIELHAGQRVLQRQDFAWQPIAG